MLGERSNASPIARRKSLSLKATNSQPSEFDEDSGSSGSIYSPHRVSRARTGEAPVRVLEAGHLYSYAELGVHHEHGGVLLRRDIHRLFDDGWLAVDPDRLRVDVSDRLESYSQYAALHGRQLRVTLRDRQIEWLARHWIEHRAS